MKKYKRMSEERFLECINKLCDGIEDFITRNNIKIDYICPVLRSGGVPAVYISNRLNVVKFAPFQVKHVAYKNGENKTEILFNPFESLEIKKDEPVFLIVEAMHSTGYSVEMCLNEIKNAYKDAKIMYVSLTKEYGSKSFEKDTIYEDTAFYCNGDDNRLEEECNKLNIEYYYPLFPWEDLDIEINHPDDLEENIYF